MTWSGDRVREARAAYVETEPVTLQKDYMFTVTRLSSVARQVVPPATRLEHMLYPWVYFAVLPLFALTNADVSFLGGDVLAMVSSRCSSACSSDYFWASPSASCSSAS